MKGKSFIQVAAGLAIAAAGIWIFSRQVHVGVLIHEMEQTRWWTIGLVVALNPMTLFLRSLRWRVLLPEKAMRQKNGLFPLVAIGFMVNNVLPARIGEAVRAMLLWRRNGFTIAESVGSLVVERVLDVMVFVTFLFVPICFMPQLAPLRLYGILLGSGFAVFVAGLLLYARMPRIVTGMVSKLIVIVPTRFRQKIVAVGTDLASNLNWLFSLRKVIIVCILSVSTLGCQVLMLQFLAHGLPHFGPLSSMFGIAFAAIGAAIPLAPGYVGTLHAMMLQGMGMVGVAADRAGAIAVLYHAIGYGTISLLGMFYFFRLKLSFGDIGKAKTELSS